MKTVMCSRIVAMMVLVFMGINVFAQDTITKAKKRMPFQVSFITPLGTNGLKSGEYINQFSLNAIAGYSGGVDGVELAGVANVTNGNVFGFQGAGVGNIVSGNVDAVQLAGVLNLNKGNLKGIQGASVINLNGGETKGVQLAGVLNAGMKNLKGIQIAGTLNTVLENNNGFQLAGVINTALASTDGGQIGGVVNFTGKDTKGIQIAGVTNITGGNVTGAQIGGVLNYAKKVKGTQIGLVNICDSIDGVTIGLLNIVRKGYYGFELESNETFLANATFKMGTRKFYNLFTVGGLNANNTDYWGYGMGFGSHIVDKEKWNLNLEGICMHVNDGEWWTNDLNLLNKIKIGVGFNVGNVELVGSISYNVFVTDKKTSENVIGDPSFIPWDTSDKTYSSTRVVRYPGCSIGVRF